MRLLAIGILAKLYDRPICSGSARIKQVSTEIIVVCCARSCDDLVDREVCSLSQHIQSSIAFITENLLLPAQQP